MDVNNKNTKILITGAAGFIGYHLSKKLLDLGLEVYGIDNLNAYYDVRLKLDRLKNLGSTVGTGTASTARGTDKFVYLDFI